MNNDKYTDMITVSDSRSTFTAHFFEPTKKMFLFQKTVKPNNGCSKITNVVVGRSIDLIRVFVTCQNQNGGTMVKFFDKIPQVYDFKEQ